MEFFASCMRKPEPPGNRDRRVCTGLINLADRSPPHRAQACRQRPRPTPRVSTMKRFMPTQIASELHGTKRELELHTLGRSVRTKRGVAPRSSSTSADVVGSLLDGQTSIVNFQRARFFRLVSRPGSPPPHCAECVVHAAIRFCKCGMPICVSCESSHRCPLS